MPNGLKLPISNLSTHMLTASLPKISLSRTANRFITMQKYKGPIVLGPIQRFYCFQLVCLLTESNYLVGNMAGTIIKGNEFFFLMGKMISMELEDSIHLIAGKLCLGTDLPKGSVASYSSSGFSVSSPFKALLLFTCLFVC